MTRRDIFESPQELTTLLEELAAHDVPVELVLAGDFFDFLQIGETPHTENRSSATISRPEYRELFCALRSFAGGEDRRVVYLPGNHDAEVWWNPEIRSTLREEGLVDEFELFYAARFESVPGRIVYCEHGNQFDPANTITDYDDPLDTPSGACRRNPPLARSPGSRPARGQRRKIANFSVRSVWRGSQAFERRLRQNTPKLEEPISRLSS